MAGLATSRASRGGTPIPCAAAGFGPILPREAGEAPAKPAEGGSHHLINRGPTCFDDAAASMEPYRPLRSDLPQWRKSSRTAVVTPSASPPDRLGALQR